MADFRGCPWSRSPCTSTTIGSTPCRTLPNDQRTLFYLHIITMVHILLQEANSAYASFMALHGDFGLFFLLCLACLYYLQPKKGASFLVRVRSALYCFLCPTMMHDWTDLLRSGQENSVGAAWKRNLRAFALVVATNFVFILIVVWIPVAELHHYTM